MSWYMLRLHVLDVQTLRCLGAGKGCCLNRPVRLVRLVRLVRPAFATLSPHRASGVRAQSLERKVRRTSAALATLLIALAAQARAQSVPAVSLGNPTATFEEPFDQVTSVRELSDGRVLVADLLARAVSLDASPADVAAAVFEQLVRPVRGPAFAMPTWDDCAEQLRALYLDVLAAHAAAMP